MSKKGEIYILEEEDMGRVKIGYAIDSQKRLKQLQTGNSHDLILRATLRCEDEMARSLESQLHERFAEYRLRGEWFQLDWQSVETAIPEEQERFKAMSGTDDLSDTGLPSVWCIYPGRDRQTVDFFLNKNFIGLGFGGLGNLTKIEPTLAAFRQTWEKRHSHMSSGQIRAFYPMFYSFVCRANAGDLVILPVTWLSDTIHIGRISGPYQYKRWRRYNDLRPVRWTAELPRRVFSTEALRGIQVNLAFFQVRKDDFLRELAEHVTA